MGIERENFYILLELPFSPPVTDEEQIKSAIRSKKQQWTRWQDNPGKRNTALTNLGLAPEIEKVMMDPDARKAEAEAAEALSAEMLRQFDAELRILEGKGYLLPREVSALSVKYRAYGVDKEQVLASARCPVSEQPPEKPEEESAEILDRLTAKKIQQNLSLLGFADLYAFLDEPPYSSIKKLQDAAERKRRDAASGGAKSSEATIAQELTGICAQLFESFDTKQKYDRYLKVGRYPALTDMVDQEFTRAGRIDPDILLRLVNFGVEKYSLSVLDAEDIIRRYCAAYGIPIGDESRHGDCPACGHKIDREAAVCKDCGAPLKGDCPACGVSFSGGPAVCAACGFPLAGMVKALSNIDEAETALIENNWSLARRSIEYAAKYWPGHPKLEGLDKRALLLEERYAKYVDDIADCTRHKQYYAALDLIHEAENRRIPLPSSPVEHVKKVVAELEETLAALTGSDEEPAFEEILRLADTVSDSIEVSYLMRRYPPDPPTRLKVQTDGSSVSLSWSVSPSVGVSDYALLRKEGSAPGSPTDGEVVYEGRQPAAVDNGSEPLKEHFYSVFARRGGACSEPISTEKAVLLIPEITGLYILPTDQGAQLNWDYNPNLRDVVIWRKLGGERPRKPEDGIRLENTRIDGYTDSKLKNGVEYWYYVVAVYVVGGKAVVSKGTCESVIPHKMLAPIEDMLIVRTDTPDEYVVNWQSAGYRDVLLFLSGEKPSYRVGDMLPVRDLLEKHQKLDLDARQPDSARFRHSWSGSAYLFPAAVSGSFATVGAAQFVARVEPVKRADWELREGNLLVTLDWPEGAEELALAYRFEEPCPEEPTDAGVNLARVTREQFEFDNGLMIRDPEALRYYCALFASVRSPEGDRIYSERLELVMNNSPQQEIYYSFRKAKRLFSKKNVITVRISSPESFQMPAAVIIGKIGRLPLSKSDGIQMFEITPGSAPNQTLSLDYRASSLPPDLYFRLFFKEDELYQKYRLLPTGGLKVN